MTININQAIQEIPEWRGKIVKIHLLQGGFTNKNYKVEIDGQPFFVRIPSKTTTLLSIDRWDEYRNSILAAATGVAPRVIHYLKEHNVMVVEFFEGGHLTPLKSTAEDFPVRLAQSLQLLHSSQYFQNDFNIFHLADNYLSTIAKNKLDLPKGFMESVPVLKRIQAAFKEKSMPKVPCHNDLITGNIIDDGIRLRFVDFEYSGNNDPCFDLGDAAMAIGFDENQTQQLIIAYFGVLDAHLLARVNLYALAAHFIWTLWNIIQKRFSELECDYWVKAMWHWEPAMNCLESGIFNRWLEDLEQGE